jgi:methionine-rich copper-binding protein CopC
MTLVKGLAGAALVLFVTTAQAHTHLKGSVPAEGSTVNAPPDQISLTFSEAARLTALTIQKEGGEEQKLTSGPLPESSAQVSVAAPKLAPGKYTVNWRVVSADNHIMSGKLHFTVAAGNSQAPAKSPAR